MRVPARLFPVAILVAALAVSGCKSPDEKAEAFYLSGIEYVKAEDPARAMIQFRNALAHVPDHRAAAVAQADLLMDLGDETAALTTLKAVSEQHPNDLELRHRLLGFVLKRQSWEDVIRQAEAIIALAPDSPEGQVAKIVRDYRNARRARFDVDAAEAAEAAIALYEERNGDDVLLRVILDWYGAQEAHAPALKLLDAELERDPDNRDMQLHRVALLARTGEQDIAGDRLRNMVMLFPEDRRVRGLLVMWLVSADQTEEAEVFLRGLADGALDKRQAQRDVIAFLEAYRGRDSATNEVARLVADSVEGSEHRYWRSVAASRAFADGAQESAARELREILADETEIDSRHTLMVTLARMLSDMGEGDEAAALIAEVLEASPLHIDALQIRAMRSLAEGETTAAISDLRGALSQRPRDPDILMLMARVHLAEGNRELAGERLASAVKVSAQAPAPSLTYAAFLRQNGRDEVAERVLRAAVERAPQVAQAKAALAELLIDGGRFGEAAVLIDDVAGNGLAQEAARLHARRLAAQGRQAEGLSFLDGLSARGEDRVRPTASVVQTLVRAGRAREALAYLDTAEENEAPALRLLQASIHALLGDAGKAAAVLDAILTETPDDVQAVSLMVPLLRALGEEDRAEAVLARALDLSPDSRRLRLMEASRREARGDIPGAITLLQRLHQENGADRIAANNLASLLTRTSPGPAAPDETAIEIARSAARGLRGLPNPAFQDTYGWVEFLRGNLGEALSYLEPAARAMPNDARVQYHLGRTYEALGRTEAARKQFALVAELDAEAELPETTSALVRLDAE